MSVVAIRGNRELGQDYYWLSSRNGSIQWRLCSFTPGLLWCRYNTQKRSLCEHDNTSKSLRIQRLGKIFLSLRISRNQAWTAQTDWDYTSQSRRCEKNVIGSVVRLTKVIVRGNTENLTQNRKNPEMTVPFSNPKRKKSRNDSSYQLIGSVVRADKSHSSREKPKILTQNR
jgi:hypothetical protein